MNNKEVRNAECAAVAAEAMADGMAPRGVRSFPKWEFHHEEHEGHEGGRNGIDDEDERGQATRPVKVKPSSFYGPSGRVTMRERNRLSGLREGCVAPLGLGRFGAGSHDWRHGLNSVAPSGAGDGRGSCAEHKLHKKVSEGIGRLIKVTEGCFYMGQGWSRFCHTLRGAWSAGFWVLLTFHTWTMRAASPRYSRLPVGATTEVLNSFAPPGLGRDNPARGIELQTRSFGGSVQTGHQIRRAFRSGGRADRRRRGRREGKTAALTPALSRPTVEGADWCRAFLACSPVLCA
ncbi:MAG: hypothetical protein JWR19_4173 [Pedosphaera sp.]|nr:hypothetical protein [Pedosphaera sp.]